MSGKTTLLQEIVQSFPNEIFLKKKFTSRPKRADEGNDEYDFTSEDHIRKLVSDGELLYAGEYHTAHGVWLYGFPKYEKPQKNETYIQAIGYDDAVGLCEADEYWFPEYSMLIHIILDFDTLVSKSDTRNDPAETKRRMNNDIDRYAKLNTSKGITYGLENSALANHGTVVNIYNTKHELSASDIVRLLQYADLDFRDDRVIISSRSMIIKQCQHVRRYDVKDTLISGSLKPAIGHCSHHFK